MTHTNKLHTHTQLEFKRTKKKSIFFFNNLEIQYNKLYSGIQKMTCFYFDVLGISTSTDTPTHINLHGQSWKPSVFMWYFICTPISLATFNFHLSVRDKLLLALVLDYGQGHKSWSAKLSCESVSPRGRRSGAVWLIEEISIFKELGLR